MRVLLVLGLLAASLAGVSAGTAAAPCLGVCAQAASACVQQCHQQARGIVAQPCLDACKAVEATCAQTCHVAHKLVPSVIDAALKPAPLSEEHYQSEFGSFVRKYKKVYPADEFFARYAVFKANYNFVRAHTLEKQRTYTVAVNEFADLTFAEFHAKYTGFKPKDRGVLRASNSEGPHKQLKAAAASVDWRANGAVTAVKNQQQCGACWAFSTTGATEGAHAIKTGQLVSLSEQQLVDCSAAQGNNGCNGGLMDNGFQFIISNGGVTTEDAYPYTAADGTCQSGQSTAATLSSFVDVAQGDESDLLAALNVGPVSVAIEADQQVFQFYSGGVLSDPGCGQQLDHGVLAVGYGTDAASGQDYWIVKNSWGPSWGESGYIRLVRGSNECGIAQSASYPVV